ncbi:hypothetical protein [Trichoplusia ni ascovirus 2c]|uniref:hypothetical protein n=1 Tax=Trichoplusia ni ascovirus 2c TaxID=328615 RepID=UPI0000E44212|nr:hypothetical protein TNAV2c_gp058 [Trichoplusia ni ascovirus 2c]ABF70575.1 hypothetical protein [Trichoplusia ni ascovirus 2c]
MNRNNENNMKDIDKLLGKRYIPLSCHGDSLVSSIPKTAIFMVTSEKEFRTALSIKSSSSSSIPSTDTMIESCVWYANKYKKIAFVRIRNNRVESMYFISVRDYKNWWKTIRVCDGDEEENHFYLNTCMDRMVINSNICNGTRLKRCQQIASPNRWYANGHIIRIDTDDDDDDDGDHRPIFKTWFPFVKSLSGQQYIHNSSDLNNTPSNIIPSYSTSYLPIIAINDTNKYMFDDRAVCEWLINMMEELTGTTKIEDGDLIINYRDHPLCTYNNGMAYEKFLTPLCNEEDNSASSVVSQPKNLIPPLSVCTGEGFKDIAIPNQDDWKRLESGVTGCQLIRRIPWRSKISQAVFRGSSTGDGITGDDNSPLVNRRMQLARISTLHPTILDAGITKWNFRPRLYKIPDTDTTTLVFPDIANEPPLKMSLTYDEQSSFKYIVHIDGHVSAFRLAAELFTESTILKVNSPWTVWFSNDLKPFKHYIPIEEDLSNLVSTIEWCIENDSICEQIAINAKQYAVLQLCRKSLMNRLSNIVNNYINTNIDTTKENNTDDHDDVNIVIDVLKRNESILNAFYNTQYKLKQYLNTAVIRYRYPQRYISSSCEALTALVLKNYMFQKTPLVGVVKMKKTLSPRVSAVAVDDCGTRFIIKTYHGHDGIRQGIRTTFVSSFALNMLNRELPTFPYTMCCIPRFCDGDYYLEVYTEYIKGASSMHDAFDNLNMEEIICISSQIYIGLRVAKERYGFRHGQLGDFNNILLVKLPEPTRYTVHTKGFGIVTIITKIIAVFVNFDKCSLSYTRDTDISSDWNDYIDQLVKRCSVTLFDDIKDISSMIQIFISNAVQEGLQNESKITCYECISPYFLFHTNITYALEQHILHLRYNVGVPWYQNDPTDVETVKMTCEFFLKMSRTITFVTQYINSNSATMEVESTNTLNNLIQCLVTMFNQYRSELRASGLTHVDIDNIDEKLYPSLVHCYGVPPLTAL